MGVLNKLKHFVPLNARVIKYNLLIFKTLKLLKVIDILNLQKLKFYYKYENNLLPYYLQNSHATRSQNKYFQWRHMHEYAKMCIRYSIPKTINNTTPNTVDKIYTHSMQGFSGYIKQSLLHSYQEHYTIPNCYIYSRS